MDADLGLLLRHSRLRAGLVRCWTREEFDESASWHRSGALCHDHFSDLVWIVGVWKGKEEDQI